LNKILFIAPHPDDETLGCGGTILKHKAAGDKTYWLIITGISEENGYAKKTVASRKQEIEMISKRYNFDGVFQLNLPTTKLDTIPRNRLIESVSGVIHDLKPGTVYMPNRNDVHSDHTITFDAVMSSAKTFRCPFIKKILSYEVPSETEFSLPLQNCTFAPNNFSDISSYLNKKIAIMRMYRSEIGKHPFPRSIENIKALATFRGATAGVKYAEAFMVLKEIW